MSGVTELPGHVDVEVVPADPADADAIRRLDGLTPATARLVDVELAAPDRCAVVARAHGEVVGYAAATCPVRADHLDEAEILDVVVAPAWRRRGIGARLVNSLLVRLWARGLRTATLEVREGNAAALALYRRLGFAVAGRRPGYYPDGEAAVIMSRRHEGPEGRPD